MKLHSPETEAAVVKDKFLHDGQWSDRFYAGWKIDHPEEVAALFALGPDPSIEQMVAVLYPKCITDWTCSECGARCREVAELGGGTYDDHVILCCADCLETAIAAIRSRLSKQGEI